MPGTHVDEVTKENRVNLKVYKCNFYKDFFVIISFSLDL